MNLIHHAASEAWQLYSRRGQISCHLLRPHVYRAWQRSHWQGASPLHMQAEHLSSLATERLLEKSSELMQAARPYMLALSAAAGSYRHAAMLANEMAVVLDVVADAATAQSSNSFPGPGSILQEALSGANGIGTPLAESGYAELVGAEHFIQGFHAYTCQGVPIKGLDNKIVGVLSTSVQRPEASERLREIMLVAAKGIGAELLIRHLERILHRIVHHPELSKGMLEKLRQDLVQIYAAGRMRLEIVALKLGQKPEVSSFEDGAHLLLTAEAAMEKFRAQSTLCLSLVSDEISAHSQVDLRSVIINLEDLLATEARIKKVQFIKDGFCNIEVYTDQRLLEKCLLRLFVEALNTAAGSSVSIEIRRDHSNGQDIEIELVPLWENKKAVQASRPCSVLKLDRAGNISLRAIQLSE